MLSWEEYNISIDSRKWKMSYRIRLIVLAQKGLWGGVYFVGILQDIIFIINFRQNMKILSIRETAANLTSDPSNVRIFLLKEQL